MEHESNKIHVACGQIVSFPGNLDLNMRQIERLSNAAAKEGARLILFAEAALTGYRIESSKVPLCISAEGHEIEEIKRISSVNDIVIAVGAFECEGLFKYISHFIIYPSGEVFVQRKYNLTNEEISVGFTAGSRERKIFKVDGVSFSITICADYGVDNLDGQLTDLKCQVHLLPCAGGGSREKICHEKELQLNPKHAKQYLEDIRKVCFVGETLLKTARQGVALVATNLAGDDGINKYHPGHSMIIDSRGCLIALHPGEYVVEFLRPLFIHGEIIVKRYPE